MEMVLVGLKSRSQKATVAFAPGALFDNKLSAMMLGRAVFGEPPEGKGVTCAAWLYWGLSRSA